MTEIDEDIEDEEQEDEEQEDEKEKSTGYEVGCTASNCPNKIFISYKDPVRVALRTVFGFEDNELKLEIEKLLKPCPSGFAFSNNVDLQAPSDLNPVTSQIKQPGACFTQTHFTWNLDELKKYEGQLISYVLKKMEVKEETFQDLVDRFESGEMGAEAYLQGIEDIHIRERVLFCVIKTWAMAAGIEGAFRGAQELDLVDYFGARVLITIADALETAMGADSLSTLSKEASNWDGMVEREIRTYLARIGKGF